MTTINHNYLQQLEANPEQEVNVIIRTNTAPTMHEVQMAELGLTITRTYRLIKAMAATGPAKAVISLASEDWVSSIEPDQKVQLYD